MTSTLTTASGNEVQITSGEAIEGAVADGFNGFGSNPRGRVTGTAIKEAATLLDKALKGSRRAALDVQEAFSTSDFTLAAFAAIDQEMVAQYEEKPSEWRKYTAVTTVRDFKPKHLRSVGRSAFGLDRVPEFTEYPVKEGIKSEDNTIRVGKFGNRYAISWEAWINDEAIDELGDIPQWFSTAAAETEAIVAAGNLVNAAGINTDFFKAGNGNTPTALPLTLANLDAAIQAVRARKVNGRVVAAPKLLLVTGPSLTTTAQRILATKELRTTVGAVEAITDNYVAGNVTHVEDPALEVVNLGAKAGTTWFLLPDPSGPRPAVYLAKLRGHETPEIRVKADTGTRVGGGAIAPEDGSFEIDDIQYRVRHVTGGAAIDPQFTYASAGS